MRRKPVHLVPEESVAARQRGGRGRQSRRKQPHLLFAAGAPPGERSRHRSVARAGLRPAWPRHRARHRRGKIRQGPARRRARRPQRAASRRPIAPTMSDKQILALYEEGSYDFVPHDGMRRTIAQRLTAVGADHPAFLRDHRLRHRQAHRRARGDQRRRAQGQRRQAGLQALGQRLRHQGAGAGAATRARRQCELDRSRHAQAQAFRRRRRRGAARRADHADRAQRRDQIAVGDLQRDARSRGARPGEASSSRTNIRAAPPRCRTSACTASRISPR